MQRIAIALIFALSACGGAPAGITVAQLEDASSAVHAMQPLDQAKAALEAKLGPASSSDDSGMAWLAKDGDTCKELHVGIMGTSVGGVEIRDAACP